MDLGLTDLVFVVTGGGRGLGRATADLLVAEGARVVLSGRSADTLDQAVAELRGDRAVAVVGDNADPTTADRVVQAARAPGAVDGALVAWAGRLPAR